MKEEEENGRKKEIGLKYEMKMKEIREEDKRSKRIWGVKEGECIINIRNGKKKGMKIVEIGNNGSWIGREEDERVVDID